MMNSRNVITTAIKHEAGPAARLLHFASQCARIALRHTPLIRPLRWLQRRLDVRNALRNALERNVVLGAGPIRYEGWIHTDLGELDIRSALDWRLIFTGRKVDRLLTEHVLEHLTVRECRRALRSCHRFLKDGGRLRIAVPDGYRRDAAYVTEVSPPRDGHQQLLNVDSLTVMLRDIGFQVEALEFFNAQQRFVARDYDEKDGIIRRSKRRDQQKAFERGDLYYTSLIVDAIKR